MNARTVENLEFFEEEMGFVLRRWIKQPIAIQKCCTIKDISV